MMPLGSLILHCSRLSYIGNWPLRFLQMNNILNPTFFRWPLGLRQTVLDYMFNFLQVLENLTIDGRKIISNGDGFNWSYCSTLY